MTTTPPATKSLTAAAICSPSRALLALGNALLIDVESKVGNKKPEGVDTNHPVFIYGHLAIYPDFILDAIGRSELKDPKSAEWHDHFMHGKDCVDCCDQYAPLDEVRAFWADRFETAINAVAEADESVFEQENPMEGLKSRCTTVGEVANFMLVMHTSFHLGQMSTWRRCMGLGPASL